MDWKERELGILADLSPNPNFITPGKLHCPLSLSFIICKMEIVIRPTAYKDYVYITWHIVGA